jgi:antitoxin (DNA-binding transcriptional repressor) of toxin-antitoxin stability system
MGAREVTATEFARNLSSLLNEVRYQGVSLEVRRGKEAVAHVVPRPRGPDFQSSASIS